MKYVFALWKTQQIQGCNLKSTYFWPLFPDWNKLIGVLQMQWNKDGSMHFCKSHSYSLKVRPKKCYI